LRQNPILIIWLLVQTLIWNNIIIFWFIILYIITIGILRLPLLASRGLGNRALSDFGWSGFWFDFKPSLTNPTLLHQSVWLVTFVIVIF
jgi:hypothetical protein